MSTISSVLLGIGTKNLINYLDGSKKKNNSFSKNKFFNKNNQKKVFNYLSKASKLSQSSNVRKNGKSSLVSTPKKNIPWYKKVTDKVSNRIENEKKWIRGKINSGKEVLSNNWDGFKNNTSAISLKSVGWLKNMSIRGKELSSQRVSKGKDWSINQWANIKDRSKKIYNSTSNSIIDKYNSGKSWTKEKAQKISAYTKEKWNTYMPKVMDFWHGTEQWVNPVLDGADILNKLKDTYENIAKGKPFYDAIPQDVKQKFKNVWTGTKNILKKSVKSSLKFTKLDKYIDPTRLTSMKNIVKSGIKNAWDYSVITTKMAMESPMGKFIAKHGGPLLKKFDTLTPLYKISQAKTVGGAVEIAIDEYGPKLGGFIIGKVVEGGLSFIPYVGKAVGPIAGFGAGIWGEGFVKDYIDKKKYASRGGKWVDEQIARWRSGNKSSKTSPQQSFNPQASMRIPKKHTPIFVNLPSGAVQISNAKNSFDAAIMANEVAQQLATHFKRAFENQRAIQY